MKLKYRMKSQLPDRSCKYCGKTFSPYRGNSKFCSTICLKRDKKNAFRKPIIEDYICSHCGSKFVGRTSARKSGKRNRFCSRSCGYKFWGPKNNKKYVYSSCQNKLAKTVGQAVRSALRNRGIKKRKRRTFSLLGYTPIDILNHVKSYFNDSNGFTFENHGTVWELDHVVPQSWFSYTDPESQEFKECWSLSNLKPIAKSTNRIKGNRYSG